jgi:hypothetical protein
MSLVCPMPLLHLVGKSSRANESFFHVRAVFQLSFHFSTDSIFVASHSSKVSARALIRWKKATHGESGSDGFCMVFLWSLDHFKERVEVFCQHLYETLSH